MKLVITENKIVLQTNNLEGRYIEVPSLNIAFQFFTEKGILIYGGSKFGFTYRTEPTIEIDFTSKYPELYKKTLLKLVTKFYKWPKAYLKVEDASEYSFPASKSSLGKLKAKYWENPAYHTLKHQGFVNTLEDFNNIFSQVGEYVTNSSGEKEYQVPKQQLEILEDGILAKYPQVENYLCWQVNQRLYESGDNRRMWNTYGYMEKFLHVNSLSKGFKHYFKFQNSKRNHIIPRGYVDKLIDHYKNSKYMKLEIQDKRKESLYVPEEFMTREYLNSLSRKLEGFDLYDSQYEAILSVAKSINNTSKGASGCYHLDLATNSGKTVILGVLSKIIKTRSGKPLKVALLNKYTVLEAKTVDDYMSQGLDVSVIAATSSVSGIKGFLMAKAKRADKEFDYLSASNSEIKAREKYLKGTELYTEPKWDSTGEFCVIMIPTFLSGVKRMKYDKKALQGYHVVICDEGDAFTSAENKIFPYLRDQARILASGTSSVFSDTSKKIDLYRVFGDPIHTITPAQNRELGVSTKAIIYKYRFKPTEFRYNSYPKIGDIYASDSFLDDVCTLLERHKDLEGQTIIYFGKQNHRYLDDFAFRIKDRGFKAITLHTKDSSRKKSDKVDKMIRGQEDVLICSSVAARGLNIKKVARIYYVYSSFDPVQFLQVCGRGDRKHEGKDKYEVWHFYYDIGRLKLNSRSYEYMYSQQKYGFEVKYLNEL